MSPAAATADARRLRLRAAGLLVAGWLAACAGPAPADDDLRTVRGEDLSDALSGHAAGEDPQRWAAEVRQLLAAPPAPGGVVFVGSSSIRGWRSLATDMAGLPVVRHGFGGSKLFDACYWSDELVTRHRPSAVVLFSGTNDLAGERPKSAAQVRDLFRLFVQRVRRDDPELPIAWIAITPTPARAEHVALVRAANDLVRAECAADPRLAFVDPTPDLATPDGAPDPRFFQRDGLHLNADGYAVWTRHVRPVAERLHAQRTAADADRR